MKVKALIIFFKLPRTEDGIHDFALIVTFLKYKLKVPLIFKEKRCPSARSIIHACTVFFQIRCASEHLNIVEKNSGIQIF